MRAARSGPRRGGGARKRMASDGACGQGDPRPFRCGAPTPPGATDATSAPSSRSTYSSHNAPLQSLPGGGFSRDVYLCRLSDSPRPSPGPWPDWRPAGTAQPSPARLDGWQTDALDAAARWRPLEAAGTGASGGRPSDSDSSGTGPRDRGAVRHPAPPRPGRCHQCLSSPAGVRERCAGLRCRPAAADRLKNGTFLGSTRNGTEGNRSTGVVSRRRARPGAI